MKVTFLGGGNMGAAIVGGLVARGFPAADITVIEPGAAARESLAARFGVAVREAAGPGLPLADALVLAVKPQQMRQAVAPLVPLPASTLVVTIAAGIRIADLSRWLGGHAAIVRAMPNTPALVHAGMTGLHAPPAVDAAGRGRAETLLGAVGETVWLPREEDLDAVTAVSGSGPAYVFYFIEALERAGVEMGLAPQAARALALGTFAGAAKLARERGEDPAVLRAQVTSKGGTTERALGEMEAAALKARFVEAVKAACARSRELGDEFGKD
ncbi:MAG: pyrroline-5-carboxylate reductase [Betaproteobacteria bacterium]|nr:pyrroline-5-carboxylate reductase [Betaproteobacteria bacterium]PWB57924.1 MAG: pyrroline-5-carboxylate reductase [Betaproteobacteria bacterium]